MARFPWRTGRSFIDGFSTMANLDRDSRVYSLAHDLGLRGHSSPFTRIREYALQIVRQCVEKYPSVYTLDGLRSALCNELSVCMEVIREDDDLSKLAREYKFPEALRKQIEREFDHEDVEGWLISNPAWKPGLRRFLAIADGRGARGVRAYFTAWHEIAHVIVTPPQLFFEGFRRSIPIDKSKDPIESVVDSIAGEIAFYEPFVAPCLEGLVQGNGLLTFEAVEHFRASVAADASFYSAAIATVRLVDRAVLLVQVKPSLRKADQRLLLSGQLQFDGIRSTPSFELRVVDVIPSEPGKSVFKIFKNMRVPPDSALTKAYESTVDIHLQATENQSDWHTTTDGYLRPVIIGVEAIRRGGFVYGLISV